MITLWEKGTHKPSLEMLGRLCVSLNVTPAEFFGPLTREAAAP